MDKHRAQIEIESLFWNKEEKTASETRAKLAKVLEELQTYNYNLGKRHGMSRAINILKEGTNKL